MVYTGTNNNMSHKSIPRIELRESNEDGGHFFMSLYTGKIHSDESMELPIDDDVVKRV